MKITSCIEKADAITSYKLEYIMCKNRFSNSKSNVNDMVSAKAKMLISYDESNYFKRLHEWKCKKYMYFCFSQRYNRPLHLLLRTSNFHLSKFYMHQPIYYKNNRVLTKKLEPVKLNEIAMLERRC